MAEKETKKENSEAPQNEAATPAKNNKKLLMIGAAVALVLILAGVAVALISFRGGKAGKAGEEDVAGVMPEQQVQAAPVDLAEDEMEENEEAIGAFFPLETFVVNLRGGSFLRVQIQLEFAERDITPRFFVRQVIIRDGILSLLTSKAAADVATPEGKESLKGEVKDLINEILKKQEIRRVYFTQFVVQ